MTGTTALVLQAAKMMMPHKQTITPRCGCCFQHCTVTSTAASAPAHKIAVELKIQLFTEMVVVMAQVRAIK